MPQGEIKLDYESDLHSNEHNLSNSEKKAWKKKFQACSTYAPRRNQTWLWKWSSQ